MHKRMQYAAAVASRAADVLAGEAAGYLLTEARVYLAEARYRVLHNASDAASVAAVAICGGSQPKHRSEALRTLRNIRDEIRRCT